MIIYLVLVVCVIGLLTYFAATQNAKVAECGRLAFACGLLVTLFEMATRVIHL